jgi:VanZ family protein
LAIKRFLTHWGPVVGFCLVIFIQSSRPFPDVIPDFHMVDKLLHFSAWTLLAVLFFRAYHEKSPFSQFKNGLLWISFLSAALYGMSDEIHQHFVPSRTADIFDFIADATGSLCGTVICALHYGVYRSPTK